MLNALETVTDVNVISSPELRVLSNREAELQIGGQVPITVPQAKTSRPRLCRSNSQHGLALVAVLSVVTLLAVLAVDAIGRRAQHVHRSYEIAQRPVLV